MSSVYVRTNIKSFITANLATENQVDLTGEYDDLEKVLEKHGLLYDDPWLGLQFIPSEDVPIAASTNNSQGLYREIGIVLLHIVDFARSIAKDGILARSETIKNAFRGQRIGDIIIESVSPPNFESGATLDFEGGYISATMSLSFYRDDNL